MFSTGLVFSPVCFLWKKHVLLESTGKWTLTAYGTETRSPIAGCNSETKPGIFYVKKIMDVAAQWAANSRENNLEVQTIHVQVYQV